MKRLGEIAMRGLPKAQGSLALGSDPFVPADGNEFVLDRERAEKRLAELEVEYQASCPILSAELRKILGIEK